LTRRPKASGVCDIDGSELYQRSDDKGEAVQKRLNIFFNETFCLLDYYRKQQKLVTVNGNQNIDQVHADILRVLSSSPTIKAGKEILTWQLPVSPACLPSQSA
jgi:adenylate kinase